MNPAPPGAGGVCAGQGSLGAALVSMALRRSCGEGHPRAAYMEGRAEELDALRRRLLELGEADARDQARMRGLAAREDELTAEESGSLARVREASLETPLEIMETCLAALRLAAVGRSDLAGGMGCDCAVGSLALWSALEGALELVLSSASSFSPTELGDRLDLARFVRTEARELLAGIRGGEAT